MDDVIIYDTRFKRYIKKKKKSIYRVQDYYIKVTK